jgi:hypothetical protein
MAEPLKDVRVTLDEIRYSNNVTIALLENELAEKEFILQQFANVIPDMVWFKSYDENGIGGQYVYANQAIRDQLLLCPNPIGSTDVELATRAKEVYGVENHTFGEKCANSDPITLENWKNGQASSRFLESGKVKGKMMYLEVHKAVVATEGGRVLGVCGSGRDVTEYIMAVKELSKINNEDVKCCLSIQKLVRTFAKYEFEEE